MHNYLSNIAAAVSIYVKSGIEKVSLDKNRTKPSNLSGSKDGPNRAAGMPFLSTRNSAAWRISILAYTSVQTACCSCLFIFWRWAGKAVYEKSQNMRKELKRADKWKKKQWLDFQGDPIYFHQMLFCIDRISLILRDFKHLRYLALSDKNWPAMNQLIRSGGWGRGLNGEIQPTAGFLTCVVPLDSATFPNHEAVWKILWLLVLQQSVDWMSITSIDINFVLQSICDSFRTVWVNTTSDPL